MKPHVDVIFPPPQEGGKMTARYFKSRYDTDQYGVSAGWSYFFIGSSRERAVVFFIFGGGFWEVERGKNYFFELLAY